MGIAILAPVPCVHLARGLDTCVAQGRVAFGSNAVEVFLDKHGTCAIPEGSRVFIATTRPQYGNGHLHSPGKAAFEATFVQWTPADNRGKHLDQILRPSSTLNDTDFIGFWEVSGLQALLKPIPFSSFADASTGAPLKMINLLGPRKVELPGN